jgi:glutamate racemase
MNDVPDLPRIDPALARPCIGVFDSGVGGLSVLSALRERLPAVSMLYVGDTAYAPYGDRPAEEVLQRCGQVVEWLAAQGATMIVVACNTATVLGIEALRAGWPELVFVGVEPGVKPGVAQSRTGRVALMTTSATAHSERLRHLVVRHAADAHVHVQACPGLVDAIERGELDGAALDEVLKPFCDAIRAAEVDTVVLGCTHYPFIEAAIRESLGGNVTLISTAGAVAERCASLWKPSPAPPGGSPTLRVLSSRETHTMRALLRQCPGFDHLQVEVLTIIPPTLPG